MRSDVKTLLGRLGRSQFKYKEFADRFSELETWPVFEAVIRDPRVFESAAHSLAPATAQSSPDAAPIGSVLSRKYGGDEAAPTQKPGGDVRSLLAQISAAAQKGTI